MYGQHIGTLNVYEKKGGTLGSVLWTLSKNKGDRWIKNEFTVIATDDFQVCYKF